MLGLSFEKSFCILLEERVKVRSERVLIGSVRNPIHSPAHWACSSVRQLLSLPELQYFLRERRQKRERRHQRHSSLVRPRRGGRGLAARLASARVRPHVALPDSGPAARTFHPRARSGGGKVHARSPQKRLFRHGGRDVV